MRQGFYTEFRCGRREHSGLAWGAIFEKMSKFQEMSYFLILDMSKKSRNRYFSRAKAPQGASRHKGAFQNQKMKI